MTKPELTIPPFEPTPLEEIPKIAATLRESFRSQKTKDVEWRLVQLRKLWWGIQDYSELLQAALKKDLNKAWNEAIFSEITHTSSDLQLTLKKLKTWVKDDKDLDYPLSFAPLRPRIKKEPLGSALIIGPYNFPVMLNLAPFIGAIAAGCTAIIKPSESAPATAMVLKQLVENYLDTTCFAVVNGAVPETTALLEEKWDKIFYTGGSAIARIISRKAAETLTPVTLELGGRNPAFVTPAADLKLAARRLMWGKTLNAGQVCMSHNYVLVHRSVVDGFVAALNATTREFYPQGAQASPDYARIVNERQFDRIKKMLDNTRGKIVMGGENDRDDLFIAPTAVLVDSIDDSMMQEESFGPIWSILPYDDLDEAIKVANSVDPTPLTVVTFGSKEENEKILNRITSGGATINDSYMHGAVSTLPFGGVGESGTGSYHGRASFDCFTHRRTVVATPSWMESLLRSRYPPHSPFDFKLFVWLQSMKPDFDREGRPIRGLGYWLWMVFSLGGSSAKGALLRWGAVAAAGVGALLQYHQYKSL
ncbi:aldehyde dehydrogenase [Camillea tinctor]|nr:aldehyde dehydrogenase [Camillea tinctor]